MSTSPSLVSYRNCALLTHARSRRGANLCLRANATCRNPRGVSAVIVGLVCLPMMVFGQASYKGSIGGVVTDPSGAVIPNATVTITENATNISRSVKTDAGGNYLFPGLRPTGYSIQVEAQGFRAAEQKAIVLQVDQEATLNFALKLGGVAARVEVTRAAPLLDTGSPSLGTDVGNDMVSQIPLPGRNSLGWSFSTRA